MSKGVPWMFEDVRENIGMFEIYKDYGGNEGLCKRQCMMAYYYTVFSASAMRCCAAHNRKGGYSTTVFKVCDRDYI